MSIANCDIQAVGVKLWTYSSFLYQYLHFTDPKDLLYYLDGHRESAPSPPCSLAHSNHRSVGCVSSYRLFRYRTNCEFIMPNFETLIDMLYQMTRSDHLVADHSVDLILQRRMPAHTTENATMGMAMLVAAHALMESNPKQFQHYNFTNPGAQHFGFHTEDWPRAVVAIWFLCTRSS